MRHDSVMVEACNASFQVHLQVDPATFANQYNIAQVLAGPVLACATNSPLLFGRRLWAETRIAVFQQSVDTRRPSHHLRDLEPRVTFGDRWLRSSILELYREDISRFSPAPSRRRGPGPVRRPRPRRGPRPGGAAAPHRHGVALEPGLLRGLERSPPPPHREPRPAVGADPARRGGQRRPVARRHGGPGRSPRGHHRAHRVRAGQVELPRRRSARPRRARSSGWTASSCRRPASPSSTSCRWPTKG